MGFAMKKVPRGGAINYQKGSTDIDHFLHLSERSYKLSERSPFYIYAEALSQVLRALTFLFTYVQAIFSTFVFATYML